MQKTKQGLRFGGFLAVAASVWFAWAAASQEERLTVEVGECVDLPTPEQRLACFEAQVEAARGAPAAAPAAPAPTTSPAPAPAPSAAPAAPATSTPPAAAAATSPAAPVTTTIAVPAEASTAPPEFGFRERPQEQEEAAPPEVRAKVAELRETVPNAFLITLDNGQVWRQTRADPYKSLRVGQDVRIYFSRWRSYRLDSPQMNGFLQVERVR